MENKVCVYAIAKNEEQHVDAWYESMKEADAIVVLDTGSTDNTVEKLKEHDVTIVTKTITPWRFDVARNESLKLVPEDCNILACIDLDEVFEPGWADILRERWVEGQHERVWYKYTWSHDVYGNEARSFLMNKIHSRNWYWQYPVHELLRHVETGKDDSTEEESLNVFNEVHLHHHPDQNKSRASYLPLLEMRKAENPNDYYGRIYLAHEYYYRGYYQESIAELQCFLDTERFVTKASPTEIASCYLFMGDCYTALGQQLKAIEAYNQAIENEPCYREPYLNLAKVYISRNQYEIAAAVIKAGIKASYRHYSWLERDVSWSYEPWDLLSLACYYSGEKQQSIIYAAKALEYMPLDERLQSNLHLCINGIQDKDLL